MFDTYYYESEVEDALILQSEKNFGIYEVPILLTYLFRRFFIVQLNNGKIPKIKKDDIIYQFFKFWLNELAIPIYDQSFIYKETKFPTNATYGSSIKNIYDNLLYQYEKSSLSETIPTSKIWEYAQEDVTKWLKDSKSQLIKYRKEVHYNHFLKKNLLKKLNNKYNSEVQTPIPITGFYYDDIPFKLTEEIICERYVATSKELFTNANLISESELESYVIRNLVEIEEGLKPIKTQYILPNGRIDILAKDKDDNIVILELKVEKDTDIVWQKGYYTSELQRKYSSKKIRFIVITTTFHNEVLEPLFNDSIQTDVYKINPIIKRGEIVEASFTSYRSSK